MNASSRSSAMMPKRVPSYAPADLPADGIELLLVRPLGALRLAWKAFESEAQRRRSRIVAS
jgi:hypothetical protein